MNKNLSKTLEALSENSRITTSNLAKKIKQPRHIAKYHRAKLEREGIIINHELLINYEALGFSEYVIYLKIFQLSKIKEKLFKAIKENPHVRWSAGVFPEFSIKICFIAKKKAEVEHFMHQLETNFGKHIIKKEILETKHLLKKESYNTKESPEEFNSRKGRKLKLKNEEKELIKILEKKPNMSLVKLAQETNLSVETIRQKIKKFLDLGFIESFSAKHEARKVGHNFWCVALIHINNLQKHEKTLQALLYSHVKFGRTKRVFGKWNIEMALFGESYLDLLKTIDDLEHLFGDDMDAHKFQAYTEHIVKGRLAPIIFE